MSSTAISHTPTGPAPVTDTTMVTQGRSRAGAAARYHTSFMRTLNSEWIKVRSLRSTWVTFAATIAIMVLITLAASWGQRSDRGGDMPTSPSAQMLIVSFVFAQMSVAVLGALTITGEHSTGMIRSTFAACPSRLPALWAKTLVTVGWTVVVAAVGLLASTGVAYLVLNPVHLMPSLSEGTTWRILGAFVLYLVLVAIVSLGVGTMIRSSAGSIFTLVGLLFILYIVAQMINLQWVHDIARALPMNLGMSMMTPSSDIASGDFTPLGALLAMIAWAVVAQVGAAILMKRRDA